MYAVYNYKAGAVAAQVIADLVALLTGTTSPSSLSASCNTASTSIVSTVAAGWSLFDAAAGVNTECVRALNQDGTTYKYLLLAGTSNTVLTYTQAESWNATTHTGTNSGGPSTNTMVVDLVNGGYFYLYATTKNAIISGWTVSGGYQNGLGIFEFSRDTLLTPAGYPCHVLARLDSVNSGGTARVPRFKSGSAAGDVSNANFATVAPICLGSTSFAGYPLYRDASEQVYFAPYNIGVGLNSGGTGHAWAGSVYDIKVALTTTAVNNLDELVISGKTYVGFAGANQVCTVFVPKE